MRDSVEPLPCLRVYHISQTTAHPDQGFLMLPNCQALARCERARLSVIPSEPQRPGAGRSEESVPACPTAVTRVRIPRSLRSLGMTGKQSSQSELAQGGQVT